MMADSMPRRSRSLCLSAIFVALLAVGCGGEATTLDLGTRAVVIGIDGADWKLIDELIAAGDMPNVAALRARGTWGEISTLQDVPLSPVIWTSVATGKSVTKHGVAWFMVDRPDGTRVPVRSSNRRTKAIWNILADHDKRAGVVGWWATYPAEDIGSGLIVSDGLGFHGFGSTARTGEDARKTYPSELYSAVEPLIPAESDVSFDFVRRFVELTEVEYATEAFDSERMARRDPANPIHLFQMYASTAQGYAAITEKLLAEQEFDLFMVYFEQVDSFSHLFIKHAPPRLPWVEEREHQRYQRVVREWYRYQDELLGGLLRQIDLDQTAVFLLSDHGFKSGDRRIRSSQTVDVRKAHLDHETHGVFIAAGPHVRSGGAEYRGASVMDITPTLLHYLGLPVARDMDGVVLEGIFDEPFRVANPRRFVETYETPDRGAVAAASSSESEEALDDQGLAEREAALRTLGYLGSAAADESVASTPVKDADMVLESSPEIHNNLGRSLFARGSIDQARREFERALSLDPHNAESLLNLSMIERLEGRTSDAEHLIKRALRVDPSSTSALASLGELKRDLGQLDESIRLFREALSIDDSPPALHLGLGDSLQRAGRFDEAERAFQSVLELDPDSFEAYYNLGVTDLARQRLDDAAEHFEQALALAPEHPQAAFALNNLGDIQLRNGDQEAAIVSFRRAAESSPIHLESRYNLGVLHLQAGELDLAIEFLEAAAELAPDHEAVGASLGMANLLAGRNAAAYNNLLLVRRLYPENWIAPLGLAALHAVSGETEVARGLLNEALRLGGDPARAEAERYEVLIALLREAPPRR